MKTYNIRVWDKNRKKYDLICSNCGKKLTKVDKYGQVHLNNVYKYREYASCSSCLEKVKERKKHIDKEKAEKEESAAKHKRKEYYENKG